MEVAIMTDADRTFVLEQMRLGEQALWSVLDKLSDEQTRSRPAPDRWSALECVEHLLLAEEGMRQLIESSTPGPAAEHAGPQRDAFILAAMQNRGKKFTAPESATPAGRFQSLAEAKAAFAQTRAKTLALLTGCNENLREKWMVHPVVGRIDCYACLLMIAMHPARHAQQIREHAAAASGS